MSYSQSANTLFHFTKTRRSLLSILKNGVYIRYSLESYGSLLKGDEELVLPMACFCDIPLSRIKEHTMKYGNYSIGLSKDWGMKNGLSPVIYAHEKSETANILNQLKSDLGRIFDIEVIKENNSYLSNEKDLTKEQRETLMAQNLSTLVKVYEKNSALKEKLGHFLKFIKPYEGKGYSNGRELNSIKFYDEREWRYVPEHKLLKKVEVKNSYKKSFYENDVKRRLINMKLASHKKLDFKPKDVKFIIVKSDDEIPRIIKELGENFEDSITYNELMLLTSRVISLEQIIEDF